MVFNFRIVSDEVDNFRREIQIDADATFLDLKNAICESVNYDKNQMCSFFICDDSWEKKKEITMEDMGADADQDVYLMDETILSDEIDDEGQRLMFTFDYLTDRSFFIEMKEMITRKTLKDPLCTLSKGMPLFNKWILTSLRKTRLKRQRKHLLLKTLVKISMGQKNTTKMNLTRKLSTNSHITTNKHKYIP